MSNSCTRFSYALMGLHKNPGLIIQSKIKSVYGTRQAGGISVQEHSEGWGKELAYLSPAQKPGPLLSSHTYEPKMHCPQFLHFCLCPNRTTSSEGEGRYGTCHRFLGNCDSLPTLT